MAVGVLLALACSPATPDPTSASTTSGQNVATVPDALTVPADFPKMLGCAADELANPPDPAVRAQLSRICDVAQMGLYALSQDQTLTDDEKHLQGLLMMGTVLQKMTELLDPGAASSPDAGTVP